MSCALLPSFDEIQEVMQLANGYMSAAEVHGLLTGLLCFKINKIDERWLIILLGECSPKIVQKVKQVLDCLFSSIKQQLSDFGFDFQMLLPADDADFSVRFEALIQWSQGFLMGMDLAMPKKSLPLDVKEALADIRQISKGDESQALTASSEEEQTLVELVEYVRLAATLIYSELNTTTKRVYH